MTDQVAVLNNHSDAVGAAVYNIGDYQSRAQYVNAIAAVEGTASQLPTPSASNTVMTRRRQREEEDQKFAKEKAENILRRDKERKNVKLSSQFRVKPDHREYYQKLITGGTNLEIHEKTRKKFPGKYERILNLPYRSNYYVLVDAIWKKTYYRLIDSNVLPPSDLTQARGIEEEIFLNIKGEVEKELGREWAGDKEQNSLADMKVAQSLKKSFQNYEKGRKGGDIKFFKF